MEILTEFMYILLFSFAGKLINYFFKLPIPGSVIGMLLLLVCLFMDVIKPRQIAKVTNFLLSNLALFFVPAGVGIIVKFNIIRNEFIQILIIILITTILAQIISGLIIQKLNNEGENDDNI